MYHIRKCLSRLFIHIIIVKNIVYYNIEIRRAVIGYERKDNK